MRDSSAWEVGESDLGSVARPCDKFTSCDPYKIPKLITTC